MTIGRMQMNRQMYQMGGEGIMQMAPQESLQSVEKELAGDPKKAFMLLVKMLMDQGIPEEEAIKIAMQMIQSVAQGGMGEMDDERVEARFGGRMGYAGGGITNIDKAREMLQRRAPEGEFLAYINPEEAGILRALGGAGQDINRTGVPSFFIKKVFKAGKKLVKGAASAVKSIAKSPLGQIALAVAAPYAIGYFAPGFATLGGSGMMGAALRGGISNMAISALSGQKIDPKNVLLSAGISGGLQGLGFGPKTNLDQTGTTAAGAAIPSVSSLPQPGSFVNAGIDSGFVVPDYTGPVISSALPSSAGTMDLLKSVVSPDSTLIQRGQAVKDLGSKALDTVFYKTAKDGTRELDKTAVLATLSTIPTYLDAKKAADEAGIEGFDEAAYNAERDKYMAQYKANLPYSSFGIQAAANGGRIGYREGTPREGIISLTDEDSGVVYRDPRTGEPLTTTEFLRRAQEDEDRENVSLTDEESGVVYEDPKTGKPLTTEEFLRMSQEDEYKELDYGASSITLPKKKTMRERSMELAVPKQINREMEDKFENYLKKLVTGKKDGGRIGYGFGSIVGGLIGKKFASAVKPTTATSSPVNTARGTSVNQLYNFYNNKETDEAKRQQIIDLFMRDNAAKGGRMGFMMGTEVPMRQNQGGITELDYRKTGGFVPVGVKEKADDVPAMLSKNEFVFTADAVRGAGKGDINKGAKMMYAKMKALEGKVKKLKKTKKKKVKV
jgi:hypothetical protein